MPLARSDGHRKGPDLIPLARSDGRREGPDLIPLARNDAHWMGTELIPLPLAPRGAVLTRSPSVDSLVLCLG
jgi:hypothetical protein